VKFAKTGVIDLVLRPLARIGSRGGASWPEYLQLADADLTTMGALLVARLFPFAFEPLLKDLRGWAWVRFCELSRQGRNDGHPICVDRIKRERATSFHGGDEGRVGDRAGHAAIGKAEGVGRSESRLCDPG
jgi:hypothetical protein